MRVSTHQWASVLVCAAIVSTAPLAHAATITVPAGGDLQAAINSAQAGDVITLASGATYVGNFTLPNDGPLTDYITIRSSAPDSALPPGGVRMTPAYASQLAKIKSPNSTAALRTKTGANHWRIMLLEFQANDRGYNDIIDLGAGDSTQTMLSQVPYALVLDRLYIHGDPVAGQKRGIGLNSSDTQILNSWITECKAIGQDSQAIGGFNGPGNYLIENNYLEGAAENFLLGGSDPTIPNLVTTNVIFRGNHLNKPISWRDAIIATPARPAATVAPGAGSLAAGTYGYKVEARMPSYQGIKANSSATAEVTATIPAGTTAGVTISWTPVVGAGDYVVYGRAAGGENTYWVTTNPYFTDTGAAGSGGTPPSATKWSVKNLFELKNAQDVLVEGNLIENVWIAGQSGYAIGLTPRNQNGTAPWTIVQRVTLQHNIVRHAAGAVNILGTDNINPSQLTNHLTITDNIFDDIGSAWGSGAKLIMIGDGGDAIVIDHNTMMTNDGTVVSLYGGSAASPTPITGFKYTNNMSEHRSYGFFGDNFGFGLPSITAYLPAYSITANVLAGGSASKYPAGNFFPTVAAWDGNFASYATGDYHLIAGSPYKNAGTDGADLGANIDRVNAWAANAMTGDARVAPGTSQVRITTRSLTDALLGAPYSQAVACVGGTPACAWQIVSSTLPDGVAFNTTSGTVSGTPTAVQTGMVTVVAYDPSWPTNTDGVSLTLTIDPPPLVVSVPPAPTGQVDASYQLTPSVTGALAPPTWSVASGELPSGTTIDPTSGQIAGTPTAWGTTTAVVQVADSWSPTRTAAASTTITVAPMPIAVSTGALAVGVYQQSYTAALIANGGSGATQWALSSGSLPAGVTLDPSGALTGTPSAIGTFAITVQATDANWPTNSASASLSLVVMAPIFAASIAAAPAGQVGAPYQTAAGATQGAVGTVTWTGAVPSGLVLNTSTGSVAGVPTSYGSFNVVLQAHDSYDASRVASAPMTIVIAPSPLGITTASLPAGSVSAAYLATLAASGGTGQTTWSIVGGALPDGLALSAAGAITGTPTAATTASVTVRAVDSGWPGYSVDKSLTLSITDAVLLDDRFDTLDRTKWPNAAFTSSPDTTVPVAVSGGQLQVGPLKASTTGSHYNGIASAAYDLTGGGAAYVQLARVSNASSLAYAMFAAGSDVNNFYRWYESAGMLVAEKKLSGTKTTLVSVPYDPSSQQYLRLRNEIDASGVKHIVFEAAPDNGGAPGVFTVMYRENWDARVLLGSIKFEIKGGTSDSIAAPGTISWDNFHATKR